MRSPFLRFCQVVSLDDILGADLVNKEAIVKQLLGCTGHLSGFSKSFRRGFSNRFRHKCLFLKPIYIK